MSPNKSAGDATSTPSFSSSRSAGHRSSAAELETRSGSSGSRHHASLKRHNARRDTKRIPLRYQKDRRAKFKSTEDLLHRLYVCISGAADQLQSNYAGDFRDALSSCKTLNCPGIMAHVKAFGAIPSFVHCTYIPSPYRIHKYLENLLIW